LNPQNGRRNRPGEGRKNFAMKKFLGGRKGEGLMRRARGGRNKRKKKERATLVINSETQTESRLEEGPLRVPPKGEREHASLAKAREKKKKQIH